MWAIPSNAYMYTYAQLHIPWPIPRQFKAIVFPPFHIDYCSCIQCSECGSLGRQKTISTLLICFSMLLFSRLAREFKSSNKYRISLRNISIFISRHLFVLIKIRNLFYHFNGFRTIKMKIWSTKYSFWFLEIIEFGYHLAFIIFHWRNFVPWARYSTLSILCLSIWIFFLQNGFSQKWDKTAFDNRIFECPDIIFPDEYRHFACRISHLAAVELKQRNDSIEESRLTIESNHFN